MAADVAKPKQLQYKFICKQVLNCKHSDVPAEMYYLKL